MPLDAIFLQALRLELTEPLQGAKIDKISMPERDMLILSVHTRIGSRKLLISMRPGSARVHFTAQSFENPPQPPMFCMLLRKHLTGARITAIEQPEGERMLLFRLDAVDELNVHSGKTLAAELMGKGLNLVLIDGEGRILDCLRRVDYESAARRALLPGLFYELPPPQPKPSFWRTGETEWLSYLSAADRRGEADKWLLDTFGGLSPLLCRELALGGWDGLPDRAAALRTRVRENRFEPVLLTEQGKPRDFSFLPLEQYGNAVQSEVYPGFSELLDAFYSRRDHLETMRRRASELTRTVNTAHARLLRKLAARQSELKATENREEYRRRGDLITANIYRLHRGMAEFETADYYEPDCPTVKIPLDVRKTPQQNAAQNYKLYNKAKTANRVLTDLIETAKSEAAYLESVMDELTRAETERDLSDIRRELVSTGYITEKNGGKRPKQSAPRKPLHFVSDSGLDILVGRSNAENDELTFRTARRDDLWLHVLNQPGSHVIVCCRGGEADGETIRTAASLAVTYSHAAGGGRAAVDCTQVRYVKKPAGAKPGQVIYSEQRTLIAEADEKLAERLRQKDG